MFLPENGGFMWRSKSDFPRNFCNWGCGNISMTAVGPFTVYHLVQSNEPYNNNTADKNFLKTKAVDIARNKIRNDNIAF